jgi:glucosamine-phosphate N-acetyltransferase
VNSIDDILDKQSDSEFQFRPLLRDDYDRGILDVLGQLTVVGDVTKVSFEERFDWLFPKHNDTYFIIVIVDRAKDKVVGSATLILERKFLRSTGIVSY